MMKFKKPNLLSIVPWLCMLVFAMLSWYFLVVRNDDVLFMHQMRSFFNDTTEFWSQFADKPAGFLQWAGCYLTQFFYHPSIGSVVLIIMWLSTFIMFKNGLRIPDAFSPLLLIPFVCLLISEIDLGYWIYYNKNLGYCFSQSLGLFITSFLLFVYSFLPLAGGRTTIFIRTIWAVVLVVLFPFIGVYTIVALAVASGVMMIKRRWLLAAVNIVLALIIPVVFSLIFTTSTISDLFCAGLPEFQMNEVRNDSLSNPFTYAIGSIVVLVFVSEIGRKIKNSKVSALIAILLLVVVTGFSLNTVASADYDDANYHAECKAYRAVEEMRWNDALDIIRNLNGPFSRQLVILKNIAVFNTDSLSNSQCVLNDESIVPSTRDNLKVSMANTAAALIFLHHGIANYAYRYAMETQVEFGHYVSGLKIMALSAIVSGEQKLADKYLNLLSHTMFYKDWAEYYRPLAHDLSLIGKYPELAKICELHNCMEDVHPADDGICEVFIANFFMNQHCTTSKYSQELSLIYTIMTKNIGAFWPQYLLYLQLHKDEKIPELYQQVAHFYAVNKPELIPDTKGEDLRIDSAVKKRYDRFNQTILGMVQRGFYEAAIGSQMRADYGDTFWWSYYYGSEIICY